MRPAGVPPTAKRYPTASVHKSTEGLHNYTSRTDPSHEDSVAQWIGRWTSMPRIGGSNPPATTFFLHHTVIFLGHCVICMAKPFIVYGMTHVNHLVSTGTHAAKSHITNHHQPHPIPYMHTRMRWFEPPSNPRFRIHIHRQTTPLSRNETV